MLLTVSFTGMISPFFRGNYLPALPPLAKGLNVSTSPTNFTVKLCRSYEAWCVLYQYFANV
ncbi:hypothetical protein F5Y05DRAFT_391267 [Hypoxylon sp. FL0543]|nr:hypothetical protein F5Y05DRAFT_391267 [Hypoxylon sp. FL0543]